MTTLKLRTPKEIWKFLTSEGNYENYDSIAIVTHAFKLVALILLAIHASKDPLSGLPIILFGVIVFETVIGTAFIAAGIHRETDSNYLICFLCGVSPILFFILIVILSAILGVMSVFIKFE